MLQRATTYHELGPDYFDKRNTVRATYRLVKRLEALGHRVILEPRFAVDPLEASSTYNAFSREAWVLKNSVSPIRLWESEGEHRMPSAIPERCPESSACALKVWLPAGPSEMEQIAPAVEQGYISARRSGCPTRSTRRSWYAATMPARDNDRDRVSADSPLSEWPGDGAFCRSASSQSLSGHVRWEPEFPHRNSGCTGPRRSYRFPV